MRIARPIFANGWKEKKIEGGSDVVVVQPERNANERYIQMKGISKAVEVPAPELAKVAIEAHGNPIHGHCDSKYSR